MDCFASIIQTDNIKCPLCRGECDESIIEETCLFVDRIEKHYHETVSDTIRRNVTQCINLVRHAIRIDLTGSENEERGMRSYLTDLSSKLSWMRVMTSAHANFSNRFFSVASVNSSSHPIYNMSPEEMFDAMFPRGMGTTVHPRRLFQEGDTPPPLTSVLLEVQENNERLEGRLQEVQQQINEVEDDINNRTLRQRPEETLRVLRVESGGWDPEVEAWEDVMLRGPTGPMVNDEVPGFD